MAMVCTYVYAALTSVSQGANLGLLPNDARDGSLELLPCY